MHMLQHFCIYFIQKKTLMKPYKSVARERERDSRSMYALLAKLYLLNIKFVVNVSPYTPTEMHARPNCTHTHDARIKCQQTEELNAMATLSYHVNN